MSVPSSNSTKTVQKLHGAADALALVQLARSSVDKTAPLFILTHNTASAERLLMEMQYFAPELEIHRLPDWETLPYDNFSPHPDLVSERLAALYQFSTNRVDVGIIPITTALTRLAPKDYLDARSFFLKQGSRLDLNGLRDQLTRGSYTHTSQVMAPGEYSVRGGLVDLFPMGSVIPYRIDLIGDDIETIRTFDIDTQRSIYAVPNVRLLPAREYPMDKSGQNHFRDSFRDHFEGDPSKCRLYKDVSNGVAPAGVEYYLPLFFEHTASLLDYMPPGSRVVQIGQVAEAAEQFWVDTKSRYELLRGDKDKPLLPPQEIFMPVEAFFVGLKQFEKVRLPVLSTDELPPIEVDRRAERPLAQFSLFLSAFSKQQGRVIVCTEGTGRRETIAQFFRDNGVQSEQLDSFADCLNSVAPLVLTPAPLSAGFVLLDEKIAVVTENELYATQVKQTRRRDKNRGTAEGMLRDLAEVKSGDPVVHSQHGIARYVGLVTMDLGEGDMEFLELHYAGTDKLFVPVSQLSVISRYTGANPENAPLHKLGSGQWEKAKRKAAQQVRDTAAELLNLYARRAARQGYAFPLEEKDFDTFSASFAFEETPDQASAIQAVKADMLKVQPMDRLVCGDVGFGKTEVALRAAFIAVSAGKQVAVLVPTTLLAEQHFQNFSDRFAQWPVRLTEFSRFRSTKETQVGLEGIANGTIDIAIGTHKLIQKDIVFKNLGLVIIDEEHRFGVRQKEMLKALRSEVDVLTLTATPIPRTLAMSLEGLRDFSVISTAPQRRLAIKTFVTNTSDGVIREAILRELNRGGQAYYLYNEVETIQNQYDKLAKLLPEARIAIAHGQLPERELERVMRDFYHQRSNVLLCSTIIETGIDVPTANTILMHRADRFGLAQLHQLRGRVGRSHHQAYAYLLTNGLEALTANAKKRLEAIQMMENLGAGFYLAMHDLEIRGAGEVLGDSQSGGIQDIGFTLYTEMLDAAVKSLKAGKEPDLSKPLNVSTEINLHVPSLLPEIYCADTHERLVIYKRLANCEDDEAIDRLHEELIDRFGLPPEPAQALIECHRLRVLGKPLSIVKIDASPNAIVIQIGHDTVLHPHKIISLVQNKRNYKLAGPDRLRIEVSHPNFADRVGEIKHVLKILAA